jgi:tetratricopeptide (TPR) repeat protein
MIGDSARQRQDLAQARAALEQAADSTGRLLALAPDDVLRLKDHASSLEQMVAVLNRMADADDVLALTRELSVLRWRAAARAPQDPALRLQALVGDQWPAAFLVNDPAQAEEGLALLTRVQQGLEGLPADLPGLARARAITLGQTGQAQFTLGRYAEAEQTLRAFFALQPAEHGGVADVRERSENRLLQRLWANTLLAQGQVGPATAVAQQGVASGEGDAQQIRDNLSLAEDLILQRLQLAELLRLGGARQQALEQLALIDAQLTRVGEVSADNVRWHAHTLGSVLALRARLRAPAPPPTGLPPGTAPPPQQPEPALLKAFEAHAQQVARLPAPGGRAPAGPRRVLPLVELLHGDLLQAQGQPAAARQRWQAVVERALPQAQQGQHADMNRLAQALLRLGQPQQARPWIERLQASSWRHPDLVELQRQLAQAERATVLARTP